jgi:hypothetical protein
VSNTNTFDLTDLNNAACADGSSEPIGNTKTPSELEQWAEEQLRTKHHCVCGEEIAYSSCKGHQVFGGGIIWHCSVCVAERKCSQREDQRAEEEAAEGFDPCGGSDTATIQGYPEKIQ